MNDVVWYSRLAVLVGALVLIAQAVTGRAVTLMTVLAVVLLCGGFVVFIAALSATGLDLSRLWVAVEAAEAEATLSATPDLSSNDAGTTAAPPPADAPAAVPVQQAPPPREETVVEEVPPAQPASQAPARPAPSGKPLTTYDVAADSPQAGVPCPRCRALLVAGQVAVTCKECDQPQHAACWIDNHFRCNTPGCSGRGSLVAPEDEPEES